jgi:hypothetical protein
MSVPLSQEAAALHAVVEQRPDHARETLRRMSGPELAALYHQLAELGTLVAAEHEARGPHPADRRLPR